MQQLSARSSATPIVRRCLSTEPVKPVERLADVSIMEHIVCPVSKYPLRYDQERGSIICDELRIEYPIRHGLPLLVPTEARIMSEDE